MSDQCQFDEKGYCFTKHKLRKKCHKNCGLCQRHHNQTCGKPPHTKRKAFGDITNKVTTRECYGKSCYSHKRLCDVKDCIKKGLCILCCPCTAKKEDIAPRPVTNVLRESKLQASLKLKELAIQIMHDEVEEAPEKTISGKAVSIDLDDLKRLFPTDASLKNIPSKAIRSSNDVVAKLEKMYKPLLWWTGQVLFLAGCTCLLILHL
jgi:hypothetical protein